MHLPQALVGLLVFFPSPGVDPPPPGVREVWLHTSDGEKLHAWHAAQHPNAPTLLWSHGNAGNLSNRADIFRALTERGLNVLLYDYRGYGGSSGRPVEDGVYEDARTAYAYLMAQGVTPENLVIFGESLGGAVSLSLATERPCAGVALLSTFSSLQDAGRFHYGALAWAVGDAFDSVSRVGRLRAPLLMLHGDHDEVIPFELGERLFAHAVEPKRFERLAGGTHNDVLGWPRVLDAVAEFSRSVASGTP